MLLQLLSTPRLVTTPSRWPLPVMFSRCDFHMLQQDTVLSFKYMGYAALVKDVCGRAYCDAVCISGDKQCN